MAADSSLPVYRDADYIADDGSFHGLRCADCDAVFVNGQPISKRLVSFIDDEPVSELVCVPCGMRAALNA